MIEYEETRACRMEFLQRFLGDDTATPCGRCDNCAGAWFEAAIGKDATDAASAALDRVGVPIEPRRQWPTGADELGVPGKGRIPADEQSDEGRAPARLTDLGWEERCERCSRRARPMPRFRRMCSPPACGC
jgi:ATP-dependent DNA helicase RecQ